MHLYIGYKNYSSWSLRPWLLMKVSGVDFEETLLPFYHDKSLEQLSERLKVPAQVPVLVENDKTIWDSLAIMESLADQFPDKKLWPEEPSLKALARSASAEMHSGFMALRGDYPMNCRTQKKSQPSDAVIQDLKRLAQLFALFAEKNTSDIPFLCGQFSIVDAMFAPVMWRVRGYGLEVSEEFDLWADAMIALPAMQQWHESAKNEQWVIDAYERE